MIIGCSSQDTNLERHKLLVRTIENFSDITVQLISCREKYLYEDVLEFLIELQSIHSRGLDCNVNDIKN
jgi:hypothetical protein